MWQGRQENPVQDAIYTRAENLNKVIDRLIDQAAAASSGAPGYLLAGIVLFIVFRAVQGFYANLRYEQQYLAWRAEPQTTLSGFHWSWAGFWRIAFGWRSFP